MSSYETLAGCYDELTEDVAYTKRADFIEKLMGRSKVPVRTVLDLACGTGTMTCLFARRGYEMIGVDQSPEMLAELYGSLDHYRELVEKATARDVQKGFVLAEDAAGLVDEVVAMAKARGLK